jgi:hypothetical protein
MELNNQERRDWKSWRRGLSQANGRSYIFITCAFCGAEVKAFLWSLAGGGKACPCGAIHGSFGQTFAPRGKKKEAQDGE